MELRKKSAEAVRKLNSDRHDWLMDARGLFGRLRNAWDLLPKELPVPDDAVWLEAKDYDEGFIQLNMYWNISYADAIGKELLKNGWALDHTYKEPSGNVCIFYYTHPKTDMGFRVHMTAIGNDKLYRSKYQSCHLERDGEIIKKETKWRVVCDEGENVP